MGSTVTTGRMAAAFRAQSGAVLYCLYEQTYEKNCTPHTPHWSAVHIGQITGALQKVFDYASSCEGGMLQNRSGWMTPEGYLRSWMSELRSPVRMTRDHIVSLYAKNDSICAPLSYETLPDVAATLGAAALKDAATKLRVGEKVSLSLFEQGDLISQLLEEHPIPAWRLLSDHTRPAAGGERDASLGIASAITKIEAPHHQPALIVSAHGDMILRDASGTWRCRGSRWEIMASYVQGLAPIEQAHPGSYRHLIQSCRDHLKAARTAEPDRLAVQVDKHLVTEEWDMKRIDDLAALPAATTDGDILTIPFDPEHEYELTHLPRAATTWRVLDDDRVPLVASQTSLLQTDLA